MLKYKNIIIVNDGELFMSCSFNDFKNEPIYKTHNNFPLKGCGAAPNINALTIVNSYLLEIYNNKEEQNLHYIVVPARLCKAIKDATYKGWLKHGCTASGKPIEENELMQWRLFSVLYKELFEYIAIKPITLYTANTGKQYAQSEYMKNRIDEMYEYLESNKEEQVVSVLENLLE
jgi:hypothetical protein